MEVFVFTKMKCIFVLRINREMQKILVNECGSLEREYTSNTTFFFVESNQRQVKENRKKIIK